MRKSIYGLKQTSR
jgi:hypothetical protein